MPQSLPERGRRVSHRDLEDLPVLRQSPTTRYSKSPPCRYNRYRANRFRRAEPPCLFTPIAAQPAATNSKKSRTSRAEPETVCPKCGHATLIRPLTAPRLNFKGAGWYVNDYASKSSDSSSESSGESKPAESKASESKKRPSPASESRLNFRHPGRPIRPASSTPSTDS